MLVVTLFIACDKQENEELIFENTIDNVNAFTENRPSTVIYSEEAHSGYFVSKIDVSSPYSPTLYLQLSEISKDPLKKVIVSAWIMNSGYNALPEIAVDIMDENKNSIEWTASGVSKADTALNKWHKIYFNVNLLAEDKNKSDNYIKVYVCNGGKDFSYVDDITIEFIR